MSRFLGPLCLSLAAAAAGVAFILTVAWVADGNWVGIPFAVSFLAGGAIGVVAALRRRVVLTAVCLGLLVAGELEPIGGLLATAQFGHTLSTAALITLFAGAIAVVSAASAVFVIVRGTQIRLIDG